MKGAVARLDRPVLDNNSAVGFDANHNIDLTAVKTDIARSKELIGSATEDLNEYHHWVKNYTESERNNRAMHARWLNRQEAIVRRQRKRQSMVQSCTRVILSCVFFVRSLARVLVMGVISALFYLRRWLSVSASWTFFQARSKALSLLRLISVASGWAAAATRVLMLAVSAAASTTFSWFAIKSRTLAVSLRSRLTVMLSWLFVRGPAITLRLLRATSAAFYRIAVKTKVIGLAVHGTASTTLSRFAVTSRTVAVSLWSRLTVILSWIRVSGPALTHGRLRAISATFYRIAVKTRALARGLWRRLSASVSWIRSNSQAVALGFLSAASDTFCRFAVNRRILWLSLVNWFSPNLSWISVKADASAVTAASVTSPWRRIDDLKLSAFAKLLLAKSERSIGFWPHLRATGIRSAKASEPRGEGKEPKLEARIHSNVSASIGHDEPRAKQSTALVRVEPWRNRLPVVRHGSDGTVMT